MPPALVISAAYDPLRNEGKQYARRTRGEGVAVTLSRYAGMVHGFVAFATGKAATAQEGVPWIRSTTGPVRVGFKRQ